MIICCLTSSDVYFCNSIDYDLYNFLQFMFVRPYLVEPREIEEFADFVKEANIAKLSAVGDFYQEAICNLIK